MNESPDLQPDSELWLKNVLPILHSCAREHGQDLFLLTIRIAQANEDIQTMTQLIRARDAQERLNRLAQQLNGLAQIALHKSGLTIQDYHKCKRDIDLALTLAGDQSGISPGGIILKH